MKLTVTAALVAASFAVIRANPRRAPNVFLAFFLTLVAASYAADAAWGALIGSGSTAAAMRAFQIEMAFNVLDPIILLYFVSVYPTRSRLNDPRIFAAAGVVTLYLAACVVAAPAQFSYDARVVAAADAGASFTYPAGRGLYDAFIVVAYTLAFAALAHAHLDAPTGDARAARARVPRAALVAAGVALLPRIAAALVDLVVPLALPGGLVEHLSRGTIAAGGAPADETLGLALRIATFAAISAIAAAGLALAHRRARAPGTATGLAIAVALPSAVLTLPLVFEGPASAIGSLTPGAEERTRVLVGAASFAARWIVFAALLAYGVLAAQLFDLERRARTLVAAAAVAAIALAAWIAAATLTRAVDGGAAPSATALFVGAAVAATSASGALPFARRLAMRAFPRADDPDFLQERKVEVFRAAIADARVAGRDPLRDPRIVAFRRSLGLSEAAHRALVLTAGATASQSTVAPPPVLPGTLLFGRYEVRSLLGTGASGRTWLARDVALDRDVALKQVFGRPREDGGDAVARYVREARAAGAARHPNVVALLEARPCGPDYVLVMEHVAGGSLAEHLARAAPLTGREVARLLDDVLAGLEAVHAKGVLHRDVKPSNILLAPEAAEANSRAEHRAGDIAFRAKLSDFGVALVPSLDSTETSLASASPQPGTLRYMAPEQAEGLAVGPTADLFSAAVVAHEALTGRPFVEGTGREMRQAVSNPAPALAGTVASPALRATLARALARRPEERFPSAREFRRALATTPEGRSVRDGAAVEL